MAMPEGLIPFTPVGPQAASAVAAAAIAAVPDPKAALLATTGTLATSLSTAASAVPTKDEDLGLPIRAQAATPPGLAGAAAAPASPTTHSHGPPPPPMSSWVASFADGTVASARPMAPSTCSALPARARLCETVRRALRRGHDLAQAAAMLGLPAPPPLAPALVDDGSGPAAISAAGEVAPEGKGVDGSDGFEVTYGTQDGLVLSIDSRTGTVRMTHAPPAGRGDSIFGTGLLLAGAAATPPTIPAEPTLRIPGATDAPAGVSSAPPPTAMGTTGLFALAPTGMGPAERAIAAQGAMLAELSHLRGYEEERLRHVAEKAEAAAAEAAAAVTAAAAAEAAAAEAEATIQSPKRSGARSDAKAAAKGPASAASAPASSPSAPPSPGQSARARVPPAVLNGPPVVEGWLAARAARRGWAGVLAERAASIGQVSPADEVERYVIGAGTVVVRLRDGCAAALAADGAVAFYDGTDWALTRPDGTRVSVPLHPFDPAAILTPPPPPPPSVQQQFSGLAAAGASPAASVNLGLQPPTPRAGPTEDGPDIRGRGEGGDASRSESGIVSQQAVRTQHRQAA